MGVGYEAEPVAERIVQLELQTARHERRRVPTSRTQEVGARYSGPRSRFMMYASRLASWLVRIALAASFASAVADRFGVWGPPGAAGVVWGDWSHFAAYSEQLNHWLPAAARPALAYAATALEVLLAVLLLALPRRTWVPALSAALLLAFAFSMTAVLGPKPALDYSAWTAAAASLLLAAQRG